MLENELLALLEDCGSPLQQTALTKGWTRTTERDFQRAVESVTGARSAPLRLEHWPAVGPVDVMLPDRTALELKWCKSGDTLANCAWDTAKLGCALAERQVEGAFLAAGAPAPHWTSSAQGVELFTSRDYEDDAIVTSYESWWRFWCRDVATRPVELPCSIGVTEVGSVALDPDAGGFVVRVARVEAIDETWRTHVCPHRRRGERCTPRSWDPKGLGGLAD